MQYSESLPLPALAAYVRCLWTFDASAEDGPADVQRAPQSGATANHLKERIY